MSLSASNEVKTAIFRDNASNEQSTTALDAQEDREILGMNVSVEMPSGDSSVAGVVEAYIGTKPLPSLGEEVDNRSFYQRFNFEKLSDTGNNRIAISEPTDTDTWFGHDEGIEWNEDSTLTVLLNETEGTATVEATVTIYYREL